ncbi:MAG: hypothetical protein H0X72_14760 [Acidobacteria bacterium]|nr:hypothetical protein [Acidobacteriota bacterium]MBA4184901.1 hypothetical protein [Acidobacteriota bacterium]
MKEIFSVVGARTARPPRAGEREKSRCQSSCMLSAAGNVARAPLADEPSALRPLN